MSAVIDILPGWLIAILLFGLLWLASIGGNRLRQRMKIASETAYATSAAVSLLALLIGFTFSMALNRYDNRRELVVDETMAIYATWERLQLEPEPRRSEMAALMRDYAEQRLAYFTFGIDQDHQLRSDHQADVLMDRMWGIVRDLAATDEKPLISRMLMDNLGRIDDVAWKREAMGREHIPFLVVDLLVVFSLLTAVSMGFAGPQDRRVHPPHLIFFALTSAAIMLVLDLDRPRSGLVLVSQRPMLELRMMMKDDVARWTVNRPPAAATAPRHRPAPQSPDASTPRHSASAPAPSAPPAPTG